MNIFDFKKMKSEGKKIAMVTAYDHWSAKIVNQSDVDCVLVGDSLAMVMHGHDSTLPASNELMALHTAAVARAVTNKFIVGDMPFLSFRKGLAPAMEAVQALMQAGAHSVKLEGYRGHEEIVKHIVDSGVPVMGHLGLTPQSIYQLGGFRVQGRDNAVADAIINQARGLEEAGCFALVLECVPDALAEQITKMLTIPTIGIGAGPHVDGQVLVLQDLLGMNPQFKPKFLRRYLQGFEIIQAALNEYARDVREIKFPSPEESYS